MMMKKYLDYLWLVGLITILAGMQLSPGDHMMTSSIAYMMAAGAFLVAIALEVMKIQGRSFQRT